MALLLSPSHTSRVDMEPVEVDKIILMVLSTLFSCSPLNDLEASLVVLKHQQQNCQNQLPLHFITIVTIIILLSMAL